MNAAAAGQRRSMTVVIQLSDNAAALPQKTRRFSVFGGQKAILSGKFISRYCVCGITEE
jgi:hypothetical protein